MRAVSPMSGHLPLRAGKLRRALRRAQGSVRTPQAHLQLPARGYRVSFMYLTVLKAHGALRTARCASLRIASWEVASFVQRPRDQDGVERGQGTKPSSTSIISHVGAARNKWM